MKRTTNRILALLMALCMLLSVTLLVACNDDEQPGTVDPGKTPTEPTDDGNTEPKDDRIPLELEMKYYGGKESVHILQWSANGVVDVGTNWIPWEEGAVEEVDAP